MEKPLVINNLVKKYGHLTAVNDVSLDLRSGEIFGLLGPNGAGKTTLISCVVSLEKATSGEIFIRGKSILKEPIEAKKNLGLVGQEVVNHGFFDVEEILHFHSGFYGIKNNHERIEFLLEKLQLGVHRHKKVRQLSGGMKRRLMIAKSLVHSPKLLLLDEPTAGVDIELRESLWEFVRELKKEGMTILLTTHHLEEAEMLCDRVGIIHNGEIKKIGETKALIAELTQREVRVEKLSGEKIKLVLGKEQTLGDALRSANIVMDEITDIRIDEGTLEDAFRRVIHA